MMLEEEFVDQIIKDIDVYYRMEMNLDAEDESE